MVCDERFDTVRRAIIHEVEVCKSLVRKSHLSFGIKVFTCTKCIKYKVHFVLKRKYDLHMERHKQEDIKSVKAKHSNEGKEIIQNNTNSSRSEVESEEFTNALYQRKLQLSGVVETPQSAEPMLPQTLKSEPEALSTQQQLSPPPKNTSEQILAASEPALSTPPPPPPPIFRYSDIRAVFEDSDDE